MDELKETFERPEVKQITTQIQRTPLYSLAGGGLGMAIAMMLHNQGRFPNMPLRMALLGGCSLGLMIGTPAALYYTNSRVKKLDPTGRVMADLRNAIQHAKEHKKLDSDHRPVAVKKNEFGEPEVPIPVSEFLDEPNNEK